MPNFDAIIIGTGQSGPALARRLVAAGRKVAIIERKLFGGTCVNTGCTPTKTLIASAYAAHVARRAADYGIRIEGPVNVDMKAVKTRKDGVVGVFRNGVEQSLKTLQGCTVYQGHGRFIAKKKVAVNGSELAADQIFINVGARAAIPPTPGLDLRAELLSFPAGKHDDQVDALGLIGQLLNKMVIGRPAAKPEETQQVGYAAYENRDNLSADTWGL